jgi:hypothetical protein
MFTRRVAMTFVLLAAAMTVVAAGQGQAPGSPAKPPAGTGAALSFSAFHGAAAVGDYLRQVAAQHPAITELVEIGRSAGNRPIQVLVVSNMKTGVAIDSLVPLQNPRVPAVNNVTAMKRYQGKPGQWIDGGAHGLSLAGTEVCLYAIDKLVSGYGADAEITKLVDDNAFYICPLVHVDAAAATAAPKAETLTPANGNFPEGWWTDDSKAGGTGTYPSSTPEARAMLEFFTNHTNILLVQSFHTSGGAGARPFARWPESRVDARDAAVFDRVLGRKYLELLGETVPASWSAPLAAAPAAAGERQAAAPGAPAGGGRRGMPGGAAPAGEQPTRRMAADQPAAWRPAFNQERQAPGAFGAFADWAYGQFGAWAVSTQAWDAQRQGKPVPGEGLVEICERHWQFEKYKASLLPRVAITDATAKVLYTTNQAGRATGAQDGGGVTVRRAAAAPGRYKVVQITATVANTGALPTQVAQGTQLRGNREDVVWLLGDRTKVTFLDGSRWVRVGVLDGSLPLPAVSAAAGAAGLRGGGGQRGAGPAPMTPLAELRVQRPETGAVRRAGGQRVVTWLVAVEGDTPLKLALTSQKGGTAVRDVAIQ